MLYRLLVLIFVSTGFCAFGQDSGGKVSIIIKTEAQTGAENATVELLRSADSVLLRSAIADKDGRAVFENVPEGTYRVRASLINYETVYAAPFSVSAAQPAITLPVLSLTAHAATQLSGVTVTARKPFIQKLSDRIVVNVESSIVSAGSTALEVLERAPGITIDQNDAISLRGRSGVVIMIDGKPTPMTGNELASYLRSLPSNAIERIDIITNPSAKYEAAGNSGIIDIRLKKDQRFGYNGTLTAGYGQGVYPKTNAGTTLNYRNKKVNVFGNYNYNFRIGLNHLMIDRNFFTNSQFAGSDKKENYSKSQLSGHTARFGADFFPGKKTIIGFVVNSSFVHFTRRNRNNSQVFDNTKAPLFNFQTGASNNDQFNNSVANLNLKHTFDSTGRELTADVDYGVYTSASLSTTGTDYFNLDGSVKQPSYILDGDQEGTLTLKTGKADYVHPLKNGWRFEAGVKTSYVSSDNDAKFWDRSNGIPENDTTKTNHFFYNESNNAGYINLKKEFKKFNIQAGLRGEHTGIKTRQEKGNVKWDSSYLQLFPSAFFNYNIAEEKTIGLSVSRRIDRPGYSQLNPFLFLIDVSTYATGNPGLLPQITWSYEASYTVKQLNFTLGYSHTNNVQNTVIVPFRDVFPAIRLPDSNVTIQVPVNLSTSDYFGITVAAPIRIAKWWNMVNNANLYYNSFNGTLAGTVLDAGNLAGDLRTNNSFTFNKGWTAELTGSVNSGGRDGFMVLKPRWALGAGVQKTIWKGKGTVRFNVTDIFWTNLPRATITYNNYIEHWHAYRETRVANLSFTYRFGNSKVQAARRRTTASEEERQRAGG